jgi:SAM-dependent methyltransferase
VSREQDDEFRRAERQWQNELGHTLLDLPYQTAGSAAVFTAQWERIRAALAGAAPGTVVEVGCGKGHLLEWLSRSEARSGRRFAGIDISRAVEALPQRGLPGLKADGEALPFRSNSLAGLVYDGALHHLIDYRGGVSEAMRVLKPGGFLIVFEPVSSAFSRLMHKLLDPIIFRKTVYESPIDQHYKGAFDEDQIVELIAQSGTILNRERTDFLAYPFTGCYAGSVFSRSPGFMRFLLAAESTLGGIPGVGRLARVFAWRFLIVARKSDDSPRPVGTPGLRTETVDPLKVPLPQGEVR